MLVCIFWLICPGLHANSFEKTNILPQKRYKMVPFFRFVCKIGLSAVTFWPTLSPTARFQKDWHHTAMLHAKLDLRVYAIYKLQALQARARPLSNAQVGSSKQAPQHRNLCSDPSLIGSLLCRVGKRSSEAPSSLQYFVNMLQNELIKRGSVTGR